MLSKIDINDKNALKDRIKEKEVLRHEKSVNSSYFKDAKKYARIISRGKVSKIS